jgi:threonine aldolase
MKIIDLRSDTVTVPSPEMRQAIAEAKVGDDVFNDDPTVQELEREAAEVLGQEAALYVSSGTMANQIALNISTNPGEEVIIEGNAHIVKYEVAGASVISGLQLAPIFTKKGIMDIDMIKPMIRPDDVHQPKTTLIAVENTHNRGGGIVYTIEQMDSICNFAKERGIGLHLDGARIWNAAGYLGIKPSVIGSKFDTVSACFSKGLGAPVGSLVASTREKIDKARRTRKMLGGGMRQVGIIAAGALFALRNNLERITEDHKRAKRLAKNLSKSGLFNLNLDEIQTNIVVMELPEKIGVGQMLRALNENGVMLVPFGSGRIRAVTHLNVNDDDIEAASEIIIKTTKSFLS